MFKIDFKYQIELIWKSKVNSKKLELYKINLINKLFQEFECPLDKEDQCLNFYSIENDDAILVKLT